MATTLCFVLHYWFKYIMSPLAPRQKTTNIMASFLIFNERGFCFDMKCVSHENENQTRSKFFCGFWWQLKIWVVKIIKNRLNQFQNDHAVRIKHFFSIHKEDYESEWSFVTHTCHFAVSNCTYYADIEIVKFS